MAAARIAWRAAQPGLNPARLVFLDESGFSTNMARRQGRSPRGKRLVAAVPHGHWKTSTLVAGLRADGIVAPLVIDHPMNGVTFRAYVEQHLAPMLTPGDIVICDNLQCHKSAMPQVAGRARRHRSARRRATLPAALFARHEPDRAGLRQAQEPGPDGRAQRHRHTVEYHRPEPRRCHAKRVRELPRPLRLSTQDVKRL